MRAPDQRVLFFFFLENWLLVYDRNRASLVAQLVKNLPSVQETRVRSLGREDRLEKEMATHSSILVWKISWAVEPGGLQSMGSQRVRHDRATNTMIETPLWGRVPPHRGRPRWTWPLFPCVPFHSAVMLPDLTLHWKVTVWFEVQLGIPLGLHGQADLSSSDARRG